MTESTKIYLFFALAAIVGLISPLLPSWVAG